MEKITIELTAELRAFPLLLLAASDTRYAGFTPQGKKMLEELLTQLEEKLDVIMDEMPDLVDVDNN